MMPQVLTSSFGRFSLVSSHLMSTLKTQLYHLEVRARHRFTQNVIQTDFPEMVEEPKLNQMTTTTTISREGICGTQVHIEVTRAEASMHHPLRPNLRWQLILMAH